MLQVRMDPPSHIGKTQPSHMSRWLGLNIDASGPWRTDDAPEALAVASGVRPRMAGRLGRRPMTVQAAGRATASLTAATAEVNS